jgi:hypothetical protein
MSSDDFLHHTKECRKRFKEVWKIVSRDCQAFEKNAIQPDQCDLVRSSVNSLSKPVQEFRVLLDSVSMLPLSVIPFRYDLLMALHQIDYAVDELSIFLISFSRICRSSSRDMMLQKQEIERKLAELKHSNEDIQQSVDRILFMARSETGGVQAVAYSLEKAYAH